ncbi:MAG: aminoacyl-tRNA deacylase [Candidatus Heimdallarchaeota archaeon]
MRLQEFIDNNGLSAEIIQLNTPSSTVEESLVALGCDPEDIIKSIVVVTNTDDFYLVILQGDRKIKTRKLKKLLNVKDIRLANPEQVKKQTGYDVGDVPPISIPLPVIMDELVINQQILYAGGGAPFANLKITLSELLDCTHPLIADISIPI